MFGDVERSESSPWSAPETVAGFVRAAPNEVLLRFAEAELARAPGARALDLGCGAGRNAIPLARLGWEVVGVDDSWPMLRAARRRTLAEPSGGRLRLLRSPMDRLGLRAASFDLLVAHGIWNLARSAAELRRALAEAARLAAPGAGLFVFTFSRSSLRRSASPVPGETFVFDALSGQRHCYLSREELLGELASVGFAPDPAVPLTEYNRPATPGACLGGPPAIYEAAFRFAG
jgi:SAM-dependent methyltransferase